MKAIFFNQHGGPEVIQYGELPEPTPGPGEVQVRLQAAALNRLDLWVRNGWPGLKLLLPHIPGADGAGEISRIGEGVVDVSVGDRVVINANLGCGRCDFCLAGEDNRCREWHLLGETIPGTCAEYVVVPARNVLNIPSDFEPRAAAGAGLVFQTGWHSLIHRAGLQAGETVLIVGASGGVNTACIQIAKFAGATTYVVGSSQEKIERALDLGADFVYDRSQEPNWSKWVYKATAKEGVNLVVDNVGADSMAQSLRAVRKGGRIVTVGNTSGETFEIDNRFIFGKHLTIIGSTMGTLRDFRQVMGLIFDGKLISVLDQDYPLAEADSALRRLEEGQQFGKITLSIS